MADKDLVFEYADIIELIPHRPPFLLIDRVDEFVLGKSARGIKAVTINEPFFEGHFPGHPIMPGVLVVEALAQTALVLYTYSQRKEGVKGDFYPYLASVSKVRFKEPVFPGAILELRIVCVGAKARFVSFEGEASVNGKVVTTANFSAMYIPAEK